MAATIVLTSAAGTNAPYKLGSPPDFGTLYSGRALEFDGVVDYVSASTPITAADSYTIATWFYSGGNSSINMWEGQQASSPSLEGGDSGWSFYVNSDTEIKTDAVSTGAWHYIVATYNESDLAMKLYLDGVLVDSDTSAATTDDAITTLYIGSRIGTSRFFDGKMSNFQIWDAAWSASDVQYAYTHPEKFASNTPGTSLTTSNLKAWYPMTEGNPRSPQTTVYDGSPKELGSELLTDGDMELAGITNWDDVTTSSHEGVITKDTSIVYAGSQSLKVVRGTGSNGADAGAGGFAQAVTTVSGKVYKYTGYVYIVSTTWSPYWDVNESIGNGSAGTSVTTTGEWVSFTEYFTATSATTFVGGWKDGGNGTVVYLDNLSLKEVQMGNHGTTTFYGLMAGLLQSGQKTFFGNALDGDDHVFDFEDNPPGGATLIDATNGFLASGGGTPTATFVVSSDLGLLTNEESAQGTVSLPIATVAGRSYQVQVSTGAQNSQVAVSLSTSTSFNDSNTTGDQAATQSNVALGTAYVADDTTSFLVIQLASSTDTEYANIDNLKVWEVGVAGSWTTADAEPLIPQTALMGMSKPMVFDGYDDKVTISDNAALDFASAITISAWINPNSVSGYQRIVDKNGAYELFLNDDEVELETDNTSTVTDTAPITANKWHHIVVTYDSTTAKIYVNGSLLKTGTPGTGAISNSANDLFIGTRSTSAQYFAGVINEVSVWDDDLTLAEIQELFNDGVALNATEHSAADDDLVAYWRNDGISSWEDREGSNDGTPSGSPVTALLPEGTTAGKDILGFPLTHPNNGWLNLDYGDYVDIGVSAVFDVDLYTIEAWIKPDVQVDNYASIYINGNWDMSFNIDKAQMKLESYINNANDINNDTALTVGTWYHVVLVDNGTNRIFYLNGEEDGDGGASVLMTAHEHVYIGRNPSQSETSYVGMIDEVKVYNRVLSTTEITKNYNHGKSKHS